MKNYKTSEVIGKYAEQMAATLEAELLAPVRWLHEKSEHVVYFAFALTPIIIGHILVADLLSAETNFAEKARVMTSHFTSLAKL